MFDMNQIRNATRRNRDTDAAGNNESTDSPARAESRPARASAGAATIGSSIVIRGDLEGNEDLVIEGRVEGTIKLAEHDLTIGEDGDIMADVHANTITVKGNLKGDLYGNERVIIRQSGNVHGNIFAPRVSIEDGARYRGSIDMESGRAAREETRGKVVEAAPVKKDKRPGKPSGEEARQA